MQSVCPFCNFVIIDPENSFFCPNCGKQLKEKPITVLKQIGIYALSFFLPPLGLFPGIKYLFVKNTKVKIIGLVAIILTIISCALTVWATMGLIDSINQNLNTQLGPYQNIIK
jgi:hypothetical protein